MGHEGDADELEVSQLLAAVTLHTEDHLLRLPLLLPAGSSCRGMIGNESSWAGKKFLLLQLRSSPTTVVFVVRQLKQEVQDVDE